MGEIEMHHHNAYLDLERGDGGRRCLFECLSILYLERNKSEFGVIQFNRIWIYRIPGPHIY